MPLPISYWRQVRVRVKSDIRVVHIPIRYMSMVYRNYAEWLSFMTV